MGGHSIKAVGEGDGGGLRHIALTPFNPLGFDDKHTFYVAQGREKNKKADGLDFLSNRGGGRLS